jgi:hypothetical protein
MVVNGNGLLEGQTDKKRECGKQYSKVKYRVAHGGKWEEATMAGTFGEKNFSGRMSTKSRNVNSWVILKTVASHTELG